MQIDAGYFHDAEHAGQNQGNTKSYDKARTQPQAEKADDEDNDNRFPQCIDKITDGIFDDFWLIRYLMQFHAGRQILFDTRLQFFQVIAQRQDIAACLHGQGNTYSRFAVIIHFGICRSCIPPFDSGNIAKTEYPSVGINRQVADSFYIFKNTADAQIYIVRLRIHHTGRRHSILAFDGIGNHRRRNAQFCQFGIGYFDIDFFRLLAYDFYFTDILYAQHDTADFFCFLPQFFIGIAIAGNRIDRPIDIIKAVIVIRSVDAFRQIFFHILCQIPHFVPRAANAVCRCLVGQIDIDDGLPRTGITFDIVQVRRILQFFFNFIRYLILHLLGCRSGPGNSNDHLPYRICRVFHPPQFHI